MKRFYISFWHNLKYKHITIKAPDKHTARTEFWKLYSKNDASIIQIKEL